MLNHILLIDDHPLFRAGLRMMLSSAMPERAVGEADSLEQALGGSGPAPALVLLDIQLQGLNGLDGMTLIRRQWPQTAVVMLSADASQATVRAALERGALRFICKSDPAVRILTVIAEVLNALPGKLAPAPARESVPGQPRLTARQCEVLDLLCQGLSNKLIGRRLNLSENTVRGHVQALLALLQVVSRSEAAFAARRRGLVG